MEDIQVTLNEEDFYDLAFGVFRGPHSITGDNRIVREQDDIIFVNNKKGTQKYFHLDKVKNGEKLLKDFYEAHKTH